MPAATYILEIFIHTPDGKTGNRKIAVTKEQGLEFIKSAGNKLPVDFLFVTGVEDETLGIRNSNLIFATLRLDK